MKKAGSGFKGSGFGRPVGRRVKSPRLAWLFWGTVGLAAVFVLGWLAGDRSNPESEPIDCQAVMRTYISAKNKQPKEAPLPPLFSGEDATDGGVQYDPLDINVSSGQSEATGKSGRSKIWDLDRRLREEVLAEDLRESQSRTWILKCWPHEVSWPYSKKAGRLVMRRHGACARARARRASDLPNAVGVPVSTAECYIEDVSWQRQPGFCQGACDGEGKCSGCEPRKASRGYEMVLNGCAKTLDIGPI